MYVYQRAIFTICWQECTRLRVINTMICAMFDCLYGDMTKLHFTRLQLLKNNGKNVN